MSNTVVVYEGQRPAGVSMPRLRKNNRSRGLTTRWQAASMVKSPCFQTRFEKRLDLYRVKCDEPSESGLKSSANRAEEALKNAEEADQFA